MRSVSATCYLTPLREGGSLPAVIDADDGFRYALKFRGAGQGTKALIADLIGGEVARLLGLRVPEIVFVTVDESFGRTEPDEEIQDLLKASTGLNLGMHFLEGAFAFDPTVTPVDAETAARILWLDAYLMNVDRTVRNTNLLVWRKELWLIDHGAALYFHHAWSDPEEAAAKPFVQIRDHVLLRSAGDVTSAHNHAREVLTTERLDAIVSLIPAAWLGKPGSFEVPDEADAEALRGVYRLFLKHRLSEAEPFLNAIHNARQSL